MTRTCTVGETAFAGRLSVLSGTLESDGECGIRGVVRARIVASGPDEGREGARIPEPEWELRQVLARGRRPVLVEVSQDPAADHRERLGDDQVGA